MLTRNSTLSFRGLTCSFDPEASGGSCGHITTSTVVTFATCNGEGTMVEDPVITYPRVSAVTTTETDSASAPFGTLVTQSTTTMNSVTIRAPMIQINWQSTDLEVASTSETIRSTASQSATGDNNSSPAGISTGAIAGITVGYVIAVLATGAAAAFLMHRRRQDRKAKDLQSARGVEQTTKYEQQQQEQQNQYEAGPSELDGRTGPSELRGTQIVAEM